MNVVVWLLGFKCLLPVPLLLWSEKVQMKTTLANADDTCIDRNHMHPINDNAEAPLAMQELDMKNRYVTLFP